MRRRTLVVSALLVVACGDGPTDPAAPSEVRTAVQPQLTASQADALTMVLQLVDDPFVLELMDGVGADATALWGVARDASISRTTVHVLTLSRVLTLTRSGLFARADDKGEDPDEEILRAALDLVLNAAVALLEPPPPGAEEE